MKIREVIRRVEEDGERLVSGSHSRQSPAISPRDEAGTETIVGHRGQDWAGRRRRKDYSALAEIVTKPQHQRMAINCQPRRPHLDQEGPAFGANHFTLAGDRRFEASFNWAGLGQSQELGLLAAQDFRAGTAQQDLGPAIGIKDFPAAFVY